MERIAFKMTLLRGDADEYKRRHQKIWPEISALLKQAGISDYAIYLDDQTNTLFATLKVGDKAQLDWLSKQQKMHEWWKYMSDITVSDAEGVPVLTALNELFYLS